MTAPTPPRARPTWLWTLHLLWVLPIVLFVQALATFWMSLAWCGISGCSGGGFGRISNPSLGAVLLGGLLVALVWFGAVAILPWHPSPRRRLIVGIVLGIVISVLVMLAGTDGFVR